MTAKVQRYFAIGSEWVYYKLYMGSQTSEIFLISVLSSIIDELLEKKVIDKWFFINYNDTGRHLRIRFHLIDEKRHLTNLIQTLNNTFSYYLERKLINDIQIGLYKRELERYGHYTIEEFETLFFLNSTLVVEILRHVSEDPNKRWLWCLKTIDYIMDDWKLSLLNKRDLFEVLKTSFGREMGTTTNINKQLSMKYRQNRVEIENMIAKGTDDLNDLLVKYKNKSQPIINSLLQKKQSGLLEDLPDKLQSYIHMHCNRIFSSRHRMNEWVIYDFLHQYYRSQVARGKQR